MDFQPGDIARCRCGYNGTAYVEDIHDGVQIGQVHFDGVWEPFRMYDCLEPLRPEDDRDQLYAIYVAYLLKGK